MVRCIAPALGILLVASCAETSRSGSPVGTLSQASSDTVYYTEEALSVSQLHDQLGVFAGNTNCALGGCSLVQGPPTNQSNAMEFYWYMPSNVFGSSLNASAFANTGLDGSGWGSSIAGPQTIGVNTDGQGSVGVAISPAVSQSGAVYTATPIVGLSPAASPFTDGNAAKLSVNLQHPFTDVPYHDGTIAGDGTVYFYDVIWFDGPNGASVTWVNRLYQDKYAQGQEAQGMPQNGATPDVVIPYASGALISTTLGSSSYTTSCGDGVFTLQTAGEATYCITISSNQFAAAVQFVNQTLGVGYPTDPSRWTASSVAMDIESVATGNNDPQIALSWYGFTFSATVVGAGGGLDPTTSFWEWTQTAVSPETFIQIASDSPPSPWRTVGSGSPSFYLFQSPSATRHAVYECEAGSGSWDFFTSDSSDCEGGIPFGPQPMGYAENAPTPEATALLQRCSWQGGGGTSHLDTFDTSICTNGWRVEGGIGWLSPTSLP